MTSIQGQKTMMTTQRNKILRWSRRLSFVPRWVVVPTIHRQNVAEHTFHVAQLCRWLLCQHVSGGDGKFCLEVITEALDHDINEAAEGDIPSPRKNRAQSEALGQKEVIIKCADLLEALSFLQEEKNMGHEWWVTPIWHDICAKFHDVWVLFEYNGHRPITSDIIKLVMFEVSGGGLHHNRHPGLE